MSALWKTMAVLATLATAAHADDRVQRLKPPPILVPGLQRVLVVQQLGDTSGVPQAALEAAFTSQLGWTNGVTAAETLLQAPLMQVVELNGPDTVQTDEIVGLSSKYDAQLFVLTSGSFEETKYREYKEYRKKAEEKEGYYVDCASRIVMVQLKATVFDGKDGRVLDQVKTVDPVQPSDCKERGENSINVPSAASAYAKSADGFALGIAKKFVPGWEVARFDTQRDASTKDTMVHLQTDRYTEFLDATAGVLTSDPYNPVAMINLAGVTEALGHLEEARLLFEYTARLTDSVEVSKGLERIAARAEPQRVLRESYGIQVTSVLPPSIQPWLAVARQALAAPQQGDVATVKGAKNKRVPVLSGPSGAPMAEIAGGMLVRVLRSDGGMVQVQLPDGKEGWMVAKDVKI